MYHANRCACKAPVCFTALKIQGEVQVWTKGHPCFTAEGCQWQRLHALQRCSIAVLVFGTDNSAVNSMHAANVSSELDLLAARSNQNQHSTPVECHCFGVTSAAMERLRVDHRTKPHIASSVHGYSTLEAAQVVASAVLQQAGRLKAPKQGSEAGSVPGGAAACSCAGVGRWLQAHLCPAPYEVLHPAAWEHNDVLAWVESFGGWAAPVMRTVKELRFDGLALCSLRRPVDAATMVWLLGAVRSNGQRPTHMLAQCMAQDLESRLAACEQAGVSQQAGSRAGPLHRVEAQLATVAPGQLLHALAVLCRASDANMQRGVPFAAMLDALQMLELSWLEAHKLASALGRSGMNVAEPSAEWLQRLQLTLKSA